MAYSFSSLLDFGRTTCGDLAVAQAREWIVTNGLGGFASGTIAGVLTRRYHGLLVAALAPPRNRTYMAAKIDEIISIDGATYSLGANTWRSGAVDPQGYRYIERFALDGSIPTWEFACGEALVEKRIWMEQGSNTTYVRYQLLRGATKASLRLDALVNYRDFHAQTHAGDWQMSINPVGEGICIHAWESATPFFLRAATASVAIAHVWYRDFALETERARGLDAHEDHLHAATFESVLAPGESLTIVISVDPNASLDGNKALERRRSHDLMLLDRFEAANPSRTIPPWIAQLALAADQFIVSPASIMAGYHWFGQWGRDTMIALPGLTLATGRPEVAADILKGFTPFVQDGMLPNVFPDAATQPQYNTMDAALWYIVAVRAYVACTNDHALLHALWPTLEEIVACYRTGTRYGICEDGNDGLVRGGQAGTALTWMDVKCGNWVVTPRIGKPIEINALWYDAQCAMAELADLLGVTASTYAQGAQRTREGFTRFWNPARGFCYDVLDGPQGPEDALRPNQIFAVSLSHSPLDATRQRAVVDVCGATLLTSNGLRSLGAEEPGFVPTYSGAPAQRDGAYHQGTAWGWLIGAWVFAHLRVYDDREMALRYLAAFAAHLDAPGIGTLPEIADATPPFHPNGTIAQAWSVGEVLRAWHALTDLLPSA